MTRWGKPISDLKSPCLKCTERFIGCRKECEKWDAFEDEKKRVYAERQAKIQGEYDNSHAFEYVLNKKCYRVRRKY